MVIQGISRRKKLVKFSRMWEECSQEEDRIVAREENMGSEDQDLIVHCKKSRTDHHKGKHSHPNKFNKNQTILRCFMCDEKVHYARECPKNKNVSHKKKGNKRRHHAHAAEDDEPSTKRIRQEVMILQVRKNMY